MIVCNSCGTLIRDDQRFCGTCSAENPLAPRQGAAAPTLQYAQYAQYAAPETTQQTPTRRGGQVIIIAAAGFSVLLAMFAGGLIVWLAGTSRSNPEQKAAVNVQATEERGATGNNVNAGGGSSLSNRAARTETKGVELPGRPIPAEEIRQFVNSWKEAWEARDLRLYARCYDTDFVGHNYTSQKEYRLMNRTEWMDDKALKFKYTQFISLALGPLSISHDGEDAVVSFSQTYQSDRQSGRDTKVKVLHLRRSPTGELKILREYVASGR